MLVEGVGITRLVKTDRGAQTTELLELPPVGPVALCRCGLSAALPLCDAEPPYACFEEVSASGLSPKPLRWEVPDPSRPGVALKPDGPVRVAGRIPIHTADGEVLTADRVSLCRCGASRCQPLCDGSHKVVGYREPLDPYPPSPPPR